MAQFRKWLRWMETHAIVTMALLLVVLLTGCASSHVESYQDPYSYNANTGYPFVGGRFDCPRP